MPTMGPGSPALRKAAIRRWFGWTRDVPTVAVGLEDDMASVLCLRRRSVITASGRVALAPGTVRDGHLRAATPAADALARLRARLHLPATARLVATVQPRSADVAGTTIVASVEADELAARAQAIVDSGFTPPTQPIFDPVPAALARLGWASDGPVYAEGSGWRTYRDREHLEIEPSDRDLTEPRIGPSPVERRPLPHPGPIAFDRGVVPVPGWPILLGAALADCGVGPGVRIDEITPVPAGSWAVEQIGSIGGGPR